MSTKPGQPAVARHNEYCWWWPLLGKKTAIFAHWSFSLKILAVYWSWPSVQFAMYISLNVFNLWQLRVSHRRSPLMHWAWVYVEIIKHTVTQATVVLCQFMFYLLQAMLESSRETCSGIQLEVNEKILDSCNQLMKVGYRIIIVLSIIRWSCVIKHDNSLTLNKT